MELIAAEDTIAQEERITVSWDQGRPYWFRRTSRKITRKKKWSMTVLEIRVSYLHK